MRQEFEPEFIAIWDRVKAYTMTSQERAYALWSAVNVIAENRIPGAFVECGVWRGGSSMLIALTLLARGVKDRDLFLFDTFKGMTEPSDMDVDLNGRPADRLLRGTYGEEVAALVRAEVSLEDVKTAMQSTGYDVRLVHFVEGDVRETLAKTQTLRLALLRLDTDFYDSTLAELRTLYPRLARGGVMIVDDYGHWRGARKAVDDYFQDPSTPFTRPVLWVIDYTGRGAVKTDDEGVLEVERYDYVPPEISPPDLLPLFPHAKAGNPWEVAWQYLRKETPHIWRFDERHDGYVTGYVSVEEAACLYHMASQFRGRRGLEIGTHYGWTAAHLLAAGLKLDCIDPALKTSERKQAVEEALDRVENADDYHLWPGLSPEIVKQVRDSAPSPWSFVFIDGDHEGEAPAIDARAVLKHLAPDAMVVFHDAISPHVEGGLAVFREAGFSTALINTMQVLGVAWRGDVVPPNYTQDPNVPHLFAPHLAKYLEHPGGLQPGRPPVDKNAKLRRFVSSLKRLYRRKLGKP